MATDGTPEAAAKRCGEEIARLRTYRRWSRAQLVIRLYDELATDDPNYDSISETWLARLENGRMVKVPRQTIEALCRALRCTARERATLLLHADRNVLAEHHCGPDAVAVALNTVMDRINRESHETVRRLLGTDDTSQLDDVQLLEAAAAAIDVLISREVRRQETSGMPTRRTSHIELVPVRQRGALASRTS